MLALVGYAAFAVAATYGFLFLRLYRELKAGKFSLFFFGKLPPLEVLERMMSGALMVGFVALTGAVATGVVWAREVLPPGAWLGDIKIVATVVTWALYAGALLLRDLAGERGSDAQPGRLRDRAVLALRRQPLVLRLPFIPLMPIGSNRRDPGGRELRSLAVESTSAARRSTCASASPTAAPTARTCWSA